MTSAPREDVSQWSPGQLPGNISAVGKRRIALLGSTGSVGTQAIDVVSANPDLFSVVALAAGGANPSLLAEQALRLGVEVVAVASAASAQDLQLAFYAAAKARGWSAGEMTLPKIIAGPQAITAVAGWPCDVVLNAITGSRGLGATLTALEAGRTVALANKESLIAGGPLVRKLLGDDRSRLIPVDSEHSALAQCLRSGRGAEVSRLVLTASGGPFRGRSAADLADVTPQQAMAHPTWQMGPVITINSATLVNKGLEMIEAHELFGTAYDRIDVVVHPQSIVHSMVEFCDGSTIAQVSQPDMRLPIALALGWPDRVPAAGAPMDWTTAQSWDFEPLDAAAFPAVGLAKAAGQAGGTAPCVFNAVNEEAVDAFLAGNLSFTRIVGLIDDVLSQHEVSDPETMDDVDETERWARSRARELIGAG